MIRSLEHLPRTARRIVCRVDMNCPLKEGRITDDTRIRACLPTIRALTAQGCSVLLLSHLGRPEGPDPTYSLQPVAERLSSLLKAPVSFLQDHPLTERFASKAGALTKGEVALAENTRFYEQEKENDAALARAFACGCDAFVFDAFGTIHRSHASTLGLAKQLPTFAGLLTQKELEAVSFALTRPQRPLTAIIGGAKVSSKLEVLTHLLEVVDTLAVGGGIANTFLAASGVSVGASLYEPDLVPLAKDMLKKAAGRIYIPHDVITTTQQFTESMTVEVKAAAIAQESIIDIGPSSQKDISDSIAQSGTVISNGPVGLFEYAPSSGGTRAVVSALSSTKAFVLIGGGDSLAALSKYGITLGSHSHISTGGGAMLELLAGKDLPMLRLLS